MKGTEITKELVEEYWPLTDVSISPMPRQGNGGFVGIIEAKEGKYTYKIPGPWKKATALERDLGVYEFLNNQGFRHISTLLKTRTGKKFVELDGSLTYIYQFIEGNELPAIPETYVELAKVTAELHSIQDFPFETDYRPADAIPELIQAAEKYQFRDEYVEILKTIPDFAHLSIVPIHTELTPQNCVLTPTGNIIALDWDEVGLGPTVLDLGVGLINHFVTEDLDILEQNAHAYYRTYFSLRNMDDNEKEYIFDAALFWACDWVRFGDIDKRWGRIKWAIQNKDIVMKLFES